jgi:hypothetical protein
MTIADDKESIVTRPTYRKNKQRLQTERAALCRHTVLPETHEKQYIFLIVYSCNFTILGGTPGDKGIF